MKPGEIEKLYRAFDTATDTDMNIGELMTVGKLFLKTPKDATRRIAIDEQLYAPPSNWYGRFVLLPKDSFDALHTYIKSQLP